MLVACCFKQHGCGHDVGVQQAAGLCASGCAKVTRCVHHNVGRGKLVANLCPVTTTDRSHVDMAFARLALEFGAKVSVSTCQQNIHVYLLAALICNQAKSVKIRISSILRHQLRVRTGLNNAALIHHDDTVCMLHG